MDKQAAIAALKEEMGPEGVPDDDPTRSVIAMLGDRWTPLILLVLSTGEWRHAQLRRAISELAFEPEISQRILTLKLRALQRDGLVYRVSTQDIPPSVSYGLTSDGHALQDQFRDLLDWLKERRPDILGHRERFDAEE